MEQFQDDARYVLERMQVEGIPHVYILGCTAQRVTVLSQQFRAFNLIWALFDSGRLKEGNRVGVVGGGIGGLTVAGAAMLKGCKVVLVEERQQVMHLQRQNATRLLHPNIYEWPMEGAEVESTRFPCMNWSADIAGQVIGRLDEEWRDLAAEFHPEVKTLKRVSQLRRTPEGQQILTSENWESAPCDVVVIAVGFGVEPPTTGLSLDSYWENDKLSQPIRGQQACKRYLVSGLGDGACIDVLRLKYADFDHGLFAKKIARLHSLEQYKSRLIQIELRMPDTGQAAYLREEYDKLSLPANLTAQLGTLRNDTYVLLNGSDPTPLSHRSCILHRVAIWSLFLSNQLEYSPGRLDIQSIETRSVETGLRYLVKLPDSEGKTAFDGVVLRHGPRSSLESLPILAGSYKKISDFQANDRTRTKCYPETFYPMRVLRRLTSDIQPLSLAGALTRGFGLEESIPPLSALGPRSDKLSVGTIRQPLLSRTPSHVRNTDAIERLTRILIGETQAQNLTQAAQASKLLDDLIMEPGVALEPEIWDAANKALWNYELYVRERAQVGGGSYDLARLRDLIKRIEHGQ